MESGPDRVANEPQGGAFRYVGVGPGGHVSLDTVRAFEAALGRAGVERVPFPTRTVRPIGKALSRVKAMPSRAARHGRPFIVTLMGPAEYRLFPISLVAPIVVYAFDVWPAKYGWWTSFFRRHSITQAFFTAQASADWFATAGVLQDAVWLPEGTDVDAFDPSRALQDRSIDVLEMGRRHPAIHEAIRTPLADAGATHLHQSSSGHVVFPSRDALVKGLADARISVCYPAADTHPDLADGVEVMTQRYLEALASGCLIVGRAPTDLVDLMGFDPVVPLDAREPAAHLLAMLEHIGDYQAHVERGRQRVHQIGRWDDRATQMLSVLCGKST